MDTETIKVKTNETELRYMDSETTKVKANETELNSLQPRTVKREDIWILRLRRLKQTKQNSTLYSGGRS
jgi:hypothetical protein